MLKKFLIAMVILWLPMILVIGFSYLPNCKLRGLFERFGKWWNDFCGSHGMWQIGAWGWAGLAIWGERPFSMLFSIGALSIYSSITNQQYEKDKQSHKIMIDEIENECHNLQIDYELKLEEKDEKIRLLKIKSKYRENGIQPHAETYS